jgi:hypothetical protein
LTVGNWLALIDMGAYDEGWERTSGAIRNRSESTWTEWMKQRRGSLGNVLRRTMLYAGPIRFPRDEPDGKYLEFEYDTDFHAHVGELSYSRFVVR